MTRPRLEDIEVPSSADTGDVPYVDADGYLKVAPPAGASGGEQVEQRWTLGGSGATSRLLDRAPVGVPIVRLNGLTQGQIDHFTVSGRLLTLLSDAAAEAGDKLRVTYHPDGTTPAAEATTSTVTVVNDSLHNAFPGLVVADDGSWIIVYRAGTGHVAGSGTILMRRSTDSGATWSSATTVGAVGGEDVRDPAITRTPYGLLVTSFTYTPATGPPLALKVWKSTDSGTSWSLLSTVTGTYSGWPACSGPIVEAADGALLWPTYGDDGGSFTRTKVLRSTDGGVTWSTYATVSSGSRVYEEPNIAVLSDGTLLMMLRVDTSTQLFATTSTDHGATWSTPVAVISTASGRPAVIEMWGRVHVMYRNGSGGPLAYAYSDDQGTTWTSGTSFAVSGNMYTYGQWADTGGLVPSAVFAEEATLSNSDVYFKRVPV